MREKILDALKTIKEDADFENSRDFIEEGLLDSFDIVELVTSLEDAFSIELRGTDIIPENFVDLETIMRLIQRYVEEA